MISKVQKTWLWIFGAMFVVPEVLFFTTPMLIRALYGESFYKLSSLALQYRLFLSHPSYLLLIILIELIGVIGLITITIKFNKILAASFGIIGVWLLFILIFTYATSGI